MIITEEEFEKAKKIVDEYEQLNLSFFNIILRNGEVISNVQKLSKRKFITEDIKLYFELGQYSGNEWIRSGKFIEIEKPTEFRDEDDRLEDQTYIIHHNFVFKKIW